MDADRFDALSRFLGQAMSRKHIVRLLAGASAVGSAMGSLGGESWAAKKSKGKKQRKLCDPTSKKKVAMCHCPPGNPDNAHVICIDDSGCGGHSNHLPCDCVCGKVPAGCVGLDGNPFPRCAPGRCKRDGSCGPTEERTTCDGVCNPEHLPCPTTEVATCRCAVAAGKVIGNCVDCPPARICGPACCPAGQICCDGSCVDPGPLCGGICGNVCTQDETCCNGECVESATLCGGICGNACADEETCCGDECVPTADLCPDCGTICGGAEVCCGGGCSSSVECCLSVQCHQVCRTGVCNEGTCEFTPTPPNEPGPFCNRAGEVCCDEGGSPVCCQRGEVCLGSGCCQLATCADFPAGTCGPQDDGCGGLTADCPCPDGQVCGAEGTCVFPACVPETIEVACAGLTCGPASDGCGADYTCGVCTAKQTCLTGACKAFKKKRCLGKGLAGQPCRGKCKCRGGRRCNNGTCCESVGDGSKHCNANSDCCPGLMCARRRPGQHKVCMRRNAKAEEAYAQGSVQETGNGG